jgi:hypothetical protein
MATKPDEQPRKPAETQQAESPRTPGLAPGAEISDPTQGRYGSPPASEGPDVAVRADSARAMIEEVVQRELRKALGKEGEFAEKAAKEAAEAERRSRERQERQAKEAADRIRQLATYKAIGQPGRVVGEIPGEQPGSGRRLVRAGEVFRYAGVPSVRWMEPLDDTAKKRIEEERDRREAIARAAGASDLAKAALTSAVADIDRVTRGHQRSEAGYGDAGAAGQGV